MIKMKRMWLALILGVIAAFGVSGVAQAAPDTCSGEYSEGPAWTAPYVYDGFVINCAHLQAEFVEVNDYLYDTTYGGTLHVPTFNYHIPETYIGDATHYDQFSQLWATTCPDGRYINWQSQNTYRVFWQDTQTWGPYHVVWTGVNPFACT